MDLVIRECEVPKNKSLFFPIANTISFCPGPDETMDDLREAAEEDQDAIIALALTIDGEVVEDLFDLRAQSPVFKTPTDGLLADFGLGACEGTPAVSDGFWVHLAPLSEGDHVIRFDALSASGFEVHVQYNLTVLDDVD